ncbi:MAG TPA: alpha/beta fold hydrolase [Vicinamibacterales bacterium]|nr:alpha/beta fold hydrolase [Vicinamibacterales bacterium]
MMDSLLRSDLRDESPLAFGGFRLDRANELLTRDGVRVPLRPKAFAMLACLATSPGRLITKQDLLETLWPDSFVGDAALKTCMREIRDALGDDARRPEYIETAHRRGYRFIARVEAAQPHADSPFAPPRTHYAREGDANVAYQVIGTGPIDLVIVNGWVTHLDYMWSEPSFACFLLCLASVARVIIFDARGTGLSDRLLDGPTPESRVDDVRIVMDAAGSARAALLGFSDGGPISALFARRYPERAAALMMFGSYAKGTRSPDYPWAPTERERGHFIDAIRQQWGGAVAIDDYAPSQAADAGFRSWWGTYLRVSAAPASAMAMARMNAALDIRGIVQDIDVPTLILHRREDRVAPLAGARHMAERMRTATFVELPGRDHLPFVGDAEAIVDAVERFLGAIPRSVSDQRPTTAPAMPG